MDSLGEIKVLDFGHVKLVDRMGDDSTIVKAARVSYQQGTKTVSDDAALINYLMRMAHSSPFEMVEFVFDIKMPMFVARQMVRHRTASINEVSGRYSELPEECYLMETTRMNKQSRNNKQGSTDELIDDAEYLRKYIGMSATNDHTLYRELLNQGMSRELARTVLPISQYTQWIWKCDLHNLFHFLKLRMDCHAQYEIRVVAEAMYELIKPLVPAACAAFEEHVLFARTFSNSELSLLRTALEALENQRTESINDILISQGWKPSYAKEFISKLGLED